MSMVFNIFHRTWWKRNPGWPDGKEPQAGKKHYIMKGVLTESEAQDVCRVWNNCHDPGFLSDKAEYEAV